MAGDPWTGYAFVIEDDQLSRLPRGRNDRGFFAKDAIFTDWSYIDRIRLLTERLVADGHYDAGWAVATRRPNCPGKGCPQRNLDDAHHRHEFGWSELAASTIGYAQFIAGLTAQIGKHYPSGDPEGLPELALGD